MLLVAHHFEISNVPTGFGPQQGWVCVCVQSMSCKGNRLQSLIMTDQCSCRSGLDPSIRFFSLVILLTHFLVQALLMAGRRADPPRAGREGHQTAIQRDSARNIHKVKQMSALSLDCISMTDVFQKNNKLHLRFYPSLKVGQDPHLPNHSSTKDRKTRFTKGQFRPY